ncbi:MAG: hypothetical protein C0619_04265 [Desulfuromonas sp.]|nr:MAG: hypothetical protein C0619_04265 [Desulfuromonas sp.]
MNQQAETLKNQAGLKKIPDSISFHLTSVFWLFLFIAALHFGVEIVVLSLLQKIPPVHPFVKAILDTTILLSVLSVGLFFGYYRPIRNHYSKLNLQKSETISYPRHTHLAESLLEAQPLDKGVLLLSPRRLVPLMIVSIFISETVIMFMLANLPPIPAMLEAIVDSTGLLIILSPTFYFFHYRPLQQNHLERKRIIAQLTASENRLQLALRAVNDSLWDCNLTTEAVYVSSRGESMLGFNPGEIEPTLTAWKELIHPDDLGQVLETWEAHINQEISHYITEHRFRTKSGKWIWVLARGQVVEWDEENRPIRIIGTHTDITERKQALLDLCQSEDEIRSLSHKLLHTAEEEKKRLALDLHDGFGQVLTAFQLGVEMLRDHQYRGKSEYQFHCDRLLKLVGHLEKDLRTICDQLRPVMLNDVGLIETLRWHIGEVNQLNKAFDIDFQITGQQELDKDLELVIYRICQEGLNNVIKHADASMVKIELILGPDKVTLSIHDNGSGLNDNSDRRSYQESTGLGLPGMKERAAAVGGQLKMISANGQGTIIQAEIPLHKMEALNDVN